MHDADLLGNSPMTMSALFMGLEGGRLARLKLSYRWDHGAPIAAWFMNNPSTAGQPVGGLALKAGQAEGVTCDPTLDPTARRVVHFSKALGAGGADLVNWCPIVETHPAALWSLLKFGAYTYELEAANNRALALVAGEASWHVVACGNEGRKRCPDRFMTALQVFKGADRLLALGASDGGAPLHPLARGKHAIRNEVVPAAFDMTKWAGVGG